MHACRVSKAPARAGGRDRAGEVLPVNEPGQVPQPPITHWQPDQVNRVQLIGSISREPLIRHLPSGQTKAEVWDLFQQFCRLPVQSSCDSQLFQPTDLIAFSLSLICQVRLSVRPGSRELAADLKKWTHVTADFWGYEVRSNRQQIESNMDPFLCVDLCLKVFIT